MTRWFLSLFLLPVLAFAELAISPEQLNESLTEHIQFSPEGPNYVGHIYIGGHQTQISQGTFLYVKNALDYYKELQPAFIRRTVLIFFRN